MNARDFRWDAPERPAARTARLWIPGLKLAGRTAKPQENAMLLRLLRFRREDRIVKQTGETRHGGERAARQPLEKKSAMDQVLVRAALAGARLGSCGLHVHGMVRNSALVISAQRRSRTASVR